MRLGFWFSVSVLVATSVGHGAGYERSVLWSGKQAGVAGAGVASVNHSEALFFNPAGLANLENVEATLNVSPTWVQPKGPIFPSGTQLSGNTSLLPIFGATVGYRLGERLGVAAGAYVSGGARAIFENLDFTSVGFTLKPNAISELTMIEYSLGVGYELFPGLKLGAAWRVMHVSGRLETPVLSISPVPSLLAVSLSDLSDTRYNGLRLGAQYEGDGWGIGALIRTGVTFTVSGVLSARGQLSPGGTAGAEKALTGNGGTVTNSFPVEGVIGGYGDFADKTFRVMVEYLYANYAANRELALTGTLDTSPLTGSATTSTLSNLSQSWKDLHTGRLGVEYRGFPTYVLRAGYAIVSDVTGKGYARATFSPPGTGHSLAIGAGHALGRKLDLDVALEYSFASGSVAVADIPAGATTQAGDYFGAVYAAHLGATYRF